MTNLTVSGATYTETFDSLDATGTALPQEWSFVETGNNANGTYVLGNGSSNSGNTYAFGAADGTDRAFGTLRSGNLITTFGSSFTNSTGSTISSLLIDYTGEQWRIGTVGRADRLDFQISYDATSLTTGTWEDVDALDFISPTQTGSAGALDGNAAANRTDISTTLNTNIAAGATFWIRWNDFDASGADDGLAVDDFSITPNGSAPAGPGTFSIANASAVEGAGFIEFTVTRAGGSIGAVTLDYDVSDITTDADDFGPLATLPGQVTFGNGQTVATIRIAIADDTDVEPNDTFSITLSNPSSGTIGTATATGTILNDDAPSLAIYEIQGESHRSNYVGQSVSTTGIVTAVASNGFYIQDAVGDGNANTSDAIFVFTRTAPTVQVGFDVTVTGTVAEFLPGNNASNLTVTQLNAAAVNIALDAFDGPVIRDLPAATVIGTEGRLPPTDVFDDDKFATFDPQNDAADFYESLEGMLVTVDAPIVVDRTNSFGETYVVASGGAGATGLNDRGGMTISGNDDGFDDYNPERVQLDDSSLSSYRGTFTQGDRLSDVTGIMSYDFQSYELLVTGTVTVTEEADEPTREVTTLKGDDTHLTMATYNVENLDPSDNKFTILANDIVKHLLAPDIIALQEIQDGDGAGNGNDTSGYVTAQGLIDAIAAIGGPDYVYIEITPAAGTTGGEPGGNIRNGFLYNASRVEYVEDSAEAITGAAFTNSRQPLAATFEFNGEEVTAISVHSSSRGSGSDPLFGSVQPPANGAEAARIAQSEAIRDYVEGLVSTDPDAKVAVLGDFNGFYFERSLELLEEGGLLTNLHRTLEEEERYSYMFGSNAQALDNFLVTGNLYDTAEFDAVHINAEQADTAARGTDHDPLVAKFEIVADQPAGPLEVDLSQYRRVGRYDLPEPTRTDAPANNLLAQEVSAVTFNWDTDSLFVVGDGGTAIVQISKTGQLIDTMTLATGDSPQGTEFYDPEGLAYIGNGRFVMVEERDRTAVLFTYTAGGVLTREDAQTANLGTNAGNVGLEGLTYDPTSDSFIFVKEKDPEGIFETTIDFANNTASNGSATTENSVNLFDPAKLGVVDLADVYALSNLSTIGTNDAGNLLVLSQESAKILEVDRQGNILSSLDIVSDPGNPLDIVSQQHEGVAMDREGNLYVVSENGGGDSDHPQLWVYAPSDVPNTAPTAIAITDAITSIEENTSTVARVKVGDVTITDDGLGSNVYSLSGADAQFFEVDSTGLYIKAGTVLDYETKQSYAVTVSVDDPRLGTTPDASTDFTLNVIDLENENVLPAVYISEIAPWSSGNSPVGADWFEVTNGSNAAINVTGWRMDDSSAVFANSVALNGIASIAPGESVIYLETDTPEATIAQFIETWFDGVAPAGLQFGTYTGSGVGLSTGGDAVTLFDAQGAVRSNVSFGASTGSPYQSFDNSAAVNNGAVADLSVAGERGAIVAANDPAEIGSPGTVGRLAITEVAPWSSGDSPVGADWFELTNNTAFAIDITGWKMDDSSGSPAAAVALNGVTSIGAGESVIFLETATPQETIAQFIETWFGGVAPEGLQFGTYTGGGVGLSTSGDAIHIYNATNVLQANVAFGASPEGPYATFDNTAGLNNVTLTQLSQVGTNNAFPALNDADEIGSPGDVSPPEQANAAPTAIEVTGATTEIAENTSTLSRVKVGDIAITDDGLGTNVLSLSGADAAFFEVDATGLYIKAGTVLDYETKQSYSVTVEVDDATIGTTPDASTAFTLNVTDVQNETTLPAIYISEIAPWSSGDSPVDADWFEVTNGSGAAINVAGWKMDDSSSSFANAVTLNGVTSIAAGESVIYLDTDTPEETIAQFIETWFDGVRPAGLQFGTYTGSGVGLSTDGDGVSLFNAQGALQSKVSFGAAPAGPFPTFDNSAAVNNGTVTELSVAGERGAIVAANDPAEIGSPGTVGRLAVTEVAPWSSGDSPVGSDWFELTNNTAFAIDLTGWKVDDSSAAFASAVALSGIASIDPGESVIFLETDTPEATISQFIETWFDGVAPEGLQFGTYTGRGIGLSTDGDAVNIYNAAGVLQANVSFGASPEGPFATFDNTAGLNNVTLTQFSQAGVNNAFPALNDTQEIGSPGDFTPPAPVNEAPTDLTLTNASVAENLPAGTLVGTLSAMDDEGDVLTYSLVDTANGRFTVNATTGAITTTGVFDYEADASKSYQILARAQDQDGLAVEQAFSIAILDVAEAPVAVNDRVSVNEDATTGNLVSQLLANDTNLGNGGLRISSVDTSGTLGTVQFDAASQTLRYVADDDRFDRLATGAQANDSFRYTVIDSQGLTSTATVQLTVTGIADGGRITGSLRSDTLFGTEGEDTISGGLGNDTLFGNGGDDVLAGGLGNDRLTGGEGQDTFVFSLLGGNDTITDFNVDEDTLQFGFGVSVSRVQVRDVDGDGRQDLTLTLGLFGLNGSVTLLGVDTYAAVDIERGNNFLTF